MTKINILSENLANKIAAGEVVERPSSVVKELVENAIDSGATKIQIFIEEGGKKLIQIVDNGCGISQDDLPLAFERHATSKIYSEKDLENINSLGFRGEALPSIASVAIVEIKSKEHNAAMGSMLVVNGGKAGMLKKLAANQGTSISIKNLFFNTPARRKFLKSNSAENQHNLTILKRFFLAYPDIEYSLTVDKKPLYNLKPGSLKERMLDVYGQEVGPDLIEIKTALGGVELEGYIGHPKAARKSRTHQQLFLNGRPIQDRSINYAINQGYGETLIEGSHPVFCLFLEINPSFFDVNIHPTKMQVRFTNERTLFYLFLNTIKKELNDKGILADLSDALQASAVQKVVLENKEQSSIIPAVKPITTVKGATGAPLPKKGIGQMSLAYFYNVEGDKLSTEQTSEDQSQTHLFSSEAAETTEVNMWQVHNKYLFSEIKSGLVIIDQHLAHARILFEKTLAVLGENSPVNAQKLLFPHKITLALDDFLVFKDIYQILNRIGFTINIFSGNTIIIEAMPSDVKIGRESQILLDIIDYYKNSSHNDFNLNEKIASAYAYKNAVKTGDKLNKTQMHALVDQLFACQYPFYSPSGKPAIVSMEMDEISRKFK